MTDTADFVPRRSARVASQKRDADEPIAAPAASKAKNGTSKKAKTEKSDGSAASAAAAATETKTLKEGDALPDIVLKDHDDKDVNVSEIAKSSTVVIFAYPKASTPGCTKQACGFRDKHEQFTANGVKVFGISADSVNAQNKFHDKQNLSYQLLSDPEYKLIGPLGAKKTAKGGVTRSHWIIKDGKLAVIALGISPADSYENSLKNILSSGETKAEEPKEEAKGEETKAEESKAEEPKTEDSKTEDSKTGDSKTEESKTEESKAEATESANGEEKAQTETATEN